MNPHATRLLNVARALRESPAPERFYMGKYTHACGTPACAFGHYAARTDLQSLFRITDTGEIQVKKSDGWEWPVTIGVHTMTHFGIDRGEWGDLFSARGCANAKTPLQAARYIEDFVRRKWPGEGP